MSDDLDPRPAVAFVQQLGAELERRWNATIARLSSGADTPSLTGASPRSSQPAPEESGGADWPMLLFFLVLAILAELPCLLIGIPMD